MRLLTPYLILFFFPFIPCQAQVIEAANEDSSRQVEFRLHQGVECEISIDNRPMKVRGKLVSVDSTSFRLDMGDSYYTTIYLNKLIRMCHRRYGRQRLAAASTGLGLLGGSTISSPSLASVPIVAASALTGLGMFLTSTPSSFRRKDPSAYQGWSFRAFSQKRL